MVNNGQNTKIPIMQHNDKKSMQIAYLFFLNFFLNFNFFQFQFHFLKIFIPKIAIVGAKLTKQLVFFFSFVMSQCDRKQPEY